MPEIVETIVYRFGELSDDAKAKARDWYREGMPDEDWYEFVYDDFEEICAILGVRLKTRSVRLCGGGTRQKSCIWFSGFWSQGDGACFEAFYSYEKNASRKIRAHAPQDVELHRIAGALWTIQRQNFYQLYAETSHRWHYYHEGCMAISVERGSSGHQDMTPDAEESVVEVLRDLARWLYRQLELEHVYQTSGAVVDEAIAANEYTFTAAGRRLG